MTSSPERFVGIDVSKDKLDVHVRPDERDLQFANSGEGISALRGCLETLHPTLVVVEATGGYEQALVASLSVAEIPLSLVNPKRSRDFAKAMGHLAKTDTIDARGLAEFAERVRPTVRPLPDADALKLQALLNRRGQLIGMRTVEKNRLAGVIDKVIRGSVERVLRALEKEIGRADRELDGAIQACPAWKAKDDLLQSIPGIGPVVSRTLLAEMPELGTMSRQQAATLAGVAPMNDDSGKRKGKRITVGGRSAVRTVLYTASHAARLGNAMLRAFADRLAQAGKTPKVIRIAIARKLLTIANAVLRDNRPWQLKMA